MTRASRKTPPAFSFQMIPRGKQKQILTIIIIVDSHISRCCVHDLSWVCRERLLVAQWQQVALFLELSNQLQRDGREMWAERSHHWGAVRCFGVTSGTPLFSVFSLQSVRPIFTWCVWSLMMQTIWYTRKYRNMIWAAKTSWINVYLLYSLNVSCKSHANIKITETCGLD